MLQAALLCSLASVPGASAIRDQRERAVRYLLFGSFPFLGLGHVSYRGAVLGTVIASHCGGPLGAS